MNNSIRSQIVKFFRDNKNFATLEAVLFTLSVLFLNLELGYWVFSAFGFILSILFYVGINYNRLFGIITIPTKVNTESTNNLNETESFLNQDLFYDLERISKSTETSISNIDSIKQELSKLNEELAKVRI